MASRTTRFYNFERVRVFVGGLRVGGYDDDGGIEIEFNSDINEPTVGADGEVTFSHINDDMAVATITLKETSRSYQQLSALATAQLSSQRSGGGLAAVTFGMFDLETGDEITEGSAVFLNTPNISKNKQAGSREIRLGLPYARRDIKFAEFLIQ